MLFFKKTLGLVGLMSLLTACPPKKNLPPSPSEKSTSSNKALPCVDTLTVGLLSNKLKGVSLVAPPNPFSKDPIASIQQLGGNWVAVLPYAYFKKNQPQIYGFSKQSWWGERPEGIAVTTQYAHQNGVKVLLKPQLWTHDQWIGELQFETEEDWRTFEQNYEQFIVQWAKIGDSLEVEMLCVGTELCQVVKKRPQFWKQLLPKIRQVYQGQLTYAPNWDSYQEVTFWDQLDYIGVDAYFPLLPTKTPTVCALKEAWKPYSQELKAFYEQWKKPILFTEYGYLSLDGAAYNTWELEKNRDQVSINEQAQANALQALLETFGEEDWWAGGFIWKWYSNHKAIKEQRSHYQAGDYTPQGKKAEKILYQLFRSS